MVTSSIAQTNKGKFLLTGTLGISSNTQYSNNNNYDQYGNLISTTSTKFTSTQFSIIPKFGYFIVNNLALGLGIGYSGYTTKNDNNSNKVTNNSITLNPFGRYYLGINDKFKFFGELGFGLSYGKYHNPGYSQNYQDNNSRGLNIYLSPGFAFFPSDKVSIELSINGINFQSFNSNTNATTGNYTSNSFSLGSTSSTTGNGFLNPKLGISFYF